MTKVVYKDLKAYHGRAFYDLEDTPVTNDRIILDKKLKGKKHLEIIIHEKLHMLFPDLTEEVITKKARELCQVLWKDGYRKN